MIRGAGLGIMSLFGLEWHEFGELNKESLEFLDLREQSPILLTESQNKKGIKSHEWLKRNLEQRWYNSRIISNIFP